MISLFILAKFYTTINNQNLFFLFCLLLFFIVSIKILRFPPVYVRRFISKARNFRLCTEMVGPPSVQRKYKVRMQINQQILIYIYIYLKIRKGRTVVFFFPYGFKARIEICFLLYKKLERRIYNSYIYDFRTEHTNLSYE